MTTTRTGVVGVQVRFELPARGWICSERTASICGVEPATAQCSLLWNLSWKWVWRRESVRQATNQMRKRLFSRVRGDAKTLPGGKKRDVNRCRGKTWGFMAGICRGGIVIQRFPDRNTSSRELGGQRQEMELNQVKLVWWPKCVGPVVT